MKLDDLKGEELGTTGYIEDSKIGPSFEEIPFKVDAGKRPPLDGFVVVEIQEGDVLHYGRIHQGQEHNPRADIHRQQQDSAYGYEDEDYRVGDMSPEVSRVMHVEVLGEIEEDDDDLEVSRPSTMPQTGQTVYRVDPEHIHKLLGTPSPGSDEGFEIGEFRAGNDSATFRLPEEIPIRHVAVLGRTGTGKTHTAHVLIEELVEKGVPVITFDILEDAKKMAESLGGRTVKPASDITIPYSLIGFSEFEGFLSSLTSDQKELVQVAYQEVHEEALKQLDREGEINVDFDDLLDGIQEYGDNIDSRATENARQRAKYAVKYNHLLGKNMDDWDQLLRENPMLNVDIGELGIHERSLVIGSLARILQRLRDRGEIPPFVLVIDEAHKYIPSGSSDKSSARVVRDLVQTARHIGIGTILISQSPSALDDTTLRTCNTHAVMALDSEEMSSVKGLFGDLADSTIRRIPKLEKGKAMIASARDMMEHTASVEIRDRRTPEGAPTPNLVDVAENWFQQNDVERPRQRQNSLGSFGKEGEQSE
jgi:DNA helicase HerA-like ATPase